MAKVENILIKPTTQIEIVTNFSALPDVALAIGLFYWCVESQGTAWLPFNLGGTFYNSGLYYSNGVEWTYQKTPFGATQTEVNTGINNDKFVTAFTFENASKWLTKYDASNPSGFETPTQLNTRDTNNRNRTNHTGTQTASTISDFQSNVTNNTDVSANTSARHTHSNKSILDLITEAFTTTLKTNYDNAYNWVVTNGANVLSHITSTSNPHNVTKSQVGLGNVDNTSDVNKLISTIQQNALNLKVDKVANKSLILDSEITRLASVTNFDNSGNVTTLNNKVDKNANITGATKTKITYDSKGLVTAGTDATTSDILDSANFRYVTDAQIATWNSLIGGSIFQSVWNANTNNPSLSNGTGTKGFYYIVNVAGATSLDGITDWKVGDWAIFDGVVWRKVDNTDAVSNVNGLTGNVLLDTSNVPETSNKKYQTDNQAIFNDATSSIQGQLDSKQDDLVSGTNIKTVNGQSLLGAGNLTISGGGGSLISGNSIFNFGNEDDRITNTISNVDITNANVKSFSFIPTETAETSLDDFGLNGLNFSISNIIDNVSFDLIGNATNNASGNYTMKYLITI
jgi:hypothetical protein